MSDASPGPSAREPGAATAERRRGLYKLLEGAAPYEYVQRALGSRRAQQSLVERFVRFEGCRRVLDVGSGTSDLLQWLPDVEEYVGIEPNADYVTRASEHYAGRGRFLQGVASERMPDESGPFDLIMAMGVLHHMPDDEVRFFFAEARRLLAEGGMVLTVDPAYVPRQGRASRALVSRDRGEHVRHIYAYSFIAREAFEDVTAHHTSRLLRIPYSHAVLVSRRAPEPLPSAAPQPF